MTEPIETADERMMRRVQDLLDKVEDFRRHGEDGSAETAFAKANEIMMKYSIDAAIVAARRATANLPVEEEIVEQVVEFKGIYKTAFALKFHAFVAAYTNTIQTFTMKTKQVEYLHIVGYESEVRQLRMVIVSVQLQAVASLNVWWHGNTEYHQYLKAMAKFKMRREYVSSFVAGATDRVRQTRQTVLGDSVLGTELALRDRRSAVEAYVAARYRLFERRTRLGRGPENARLAGHAAGRRANTGDTPLANRRRQLES